MKKKVCTRCGKAKSTGEFNKSATRKEGLRAHCKQCEREQAREFYRRNPIPYKRRAKVQQERVREHLLGVIQDIKKTGCVFCGEMEPCVLDYHHVIPGRPVGRVLDSYSGVERELSRCVVVCANCHRKTHAGLLFVSTTMLSKYRVARAGQTGLPLWQRLAS